MGVAGIEPTSQALEARILPLNYTPARNTIKIDFKNIWFEENTENRLFDKNLQFLNLFFTNRTAMIL